MTPDLPEYNAAIDRYRDYLVVQEHAAPKDYPRPEDPASVCSTYAGRHQGDRHDGEKVILKVRERQEGKQQPRSCPKSSTGMEWCRSTVPVCGSTLRDYLIPASSFDHRQTRRMLGQDGQRQALPEPVCPYCATVHAGLGGAGETTTVDMSHVSTSN